MDRWLMNGWIDNQRDRQKDRTVDGQTDRQIDRNFKDKMQLEKLLIKQTIDRQMNS